MLGLGLEAKLFGLGVQGFGHGAQDLGIGQNIQRVPLLSFPYPSPPIPFKGLPSEIFMLVHEFY